MKKLQRKKRKQGAVKELYFALKEGSFATRLSFLFSGFGFIARGQVIKGAIYTLLQSLFLLFMFLFGWRYIAHLF